MNRNRFNSGLSTFAPDATATNATGILWTTSGTGTFSDDTLINTVYTPSADDIDAGSVILTLTAQSASPCVATTDIVRLTINRQAVISAGMDSVICEGSAFAITDATTTYATSIVWTTSGTGTFSNSTILHPIYTPSVADISDGSVTLT